MPRHNRIEDIGLPCCASREKLEAFQFSPIVNQGTGNETPVVDIERIMRDVKKTYVEDTLMLVSVKSLWDEFIVTKKYEYTLRSGVRIKYRSPPITARLKESTWEDIDKFICNQPCNELLFIEYITEDLKSRNCFIAEQSKTNKELYFMYIQKCNNFSELFVAKTILKDYIIGKLYQ